MVFAMATTSFAQFPESTSMQIDFTAPEPDNFCQMSEYTLDSHDFEGDDNVTYWATNSGGKNHGFNLPAEPMSALVENPQYDEEDPFSMKKAYARRWWSFEYPGHQRETSLQIIDWPMEVIRVRATGAVVSAGRSNAIRTTIHTLFPRKVLPSVRFVHPAGKSSYFEVTLSTGETARFDGLTRKVISGAVSEVAAADGGLTPWGTYTPDPPEEDDEESNQDGLVAREDLLTVGPTPTPNPSQDVPVVVRSAPRSQSIPDAPELPVVAVISSPSPTPTPSPAPSIPMQTRLVYPSTVGDYAGAGLTLISPVTDADFRDPGHPITARTGSPDAACLKSARTAAQKKACSQCVLKSEDLWMSVSGDSYSCRIFKFPTDAAFDTYLRSQCGFGIPKI